MFQEEFGVFLKAGGQGKVFQEADVLGSSSESRLSESWGPLKTTHLDFQDHGVQEQIFLEEGFQKPFCRHPHQLRKRPFGFFFKTFQFSR